MFFLNVGYKWNMLTDVPHVAGVVYLPSHKGIQAFLRKELPATTHRLFDPQLYLAGLDADHCVKACSRLAMYPWFRVPGIEDFDSEEMSARDWENALRELIAQHWPDKAPLDEDIDERSREAIEFQREMGCTELILPAPMILDANDGG